MLSEQQRQTFLISALLKTQCSFFWSLSNILQILLTEAWVLCQTAMSNYPSYFAPTPFWQCWCHLPSYSLASLDIYFQKCVWLLFFQGNLGLVPQAWHAKCREKPWAEGSRGKGEPWCKGPFLFLPLLIESIVCPRLGRRRWLGLVAQLCIGVQEMETGDFLNGTFLLSQRNWS